MNMHKETLLLGLAARFIRELTAFGGIQEGAVSTIGPPPYRRIDCDGRALVYVRVRPRKEAVRVDLSGLWHLPGPAPQGVNGAGGAATMLLKSEHDIMPAVSFIRSVVEHTRSRWSAPLRRPFQAGKLMEVDPKASLPVVRPHPDKPTDPDPNAGAAP